jgi:hypothetical protein
VQHAPKQKPDTKKTKEKAIQKQLTTLAMSVNHSFVIQQTIEHSLEDRPTPSLAVVG